MKHEKISRYRRASELALAAAAAVTFFIGSVDCGEEDNSCEVNADCGDSPAARDIRRKKCGSEVYCSGGTCKGECLDWCQPIVTDTNPCEGGRLCAPQAGSPDSICTMLPVKCSSIEDCPVYLPPTESGPSAWSCNGGKCENPAWTYASH